MNSSAPAIPKQKITRRRLIGGAVAFLSLAALVWTGMIFSAEYRFRLLSRAKVDETDKQSLNRYVLALEGLLRLDPTNGEILNKHASISAILGEYDRAIADILRAKKTSNAQNTLYFLADMYEKKLDIPKAESTMAECVIINPTDPKFNAARLRLLNNRLLLFTARRAKGLPVNPDEEAAARRDFAEASINWAIRAPHDMNSYFFIGNFYVDRQLFVQAYRSFLIGLQGLVSRPRWMFLNADMEPMVSIKGVLTTIQQIMIFKKAKPYKNLPAFDETPGAAGAKP